MKLSLADIKALNPCKHRLDNFISHYPDFDADIEAFLELENVTYDDKIWVARRLMNKKKKWQRVVSVSLDELALLCLNVDYKIKGDCLDAAKNLSVELQDIFEFDTHEYRNAIKKHIQGAV